MKKLLIAAALTATAFSSPLYAQQRGGVLIVDSDRAMTECTACRTASTQLQQRQSALVARAQQLQNQLQTDGKPIQAAVDALNGKEPDAALQQRISAFQSRQRTAEAELNNSKQTFESTVANVQQQIGTRLVAVVEQVRARHGAAIVLAKKSTIANDTTLDVTTEVVTALNQQLPSVSITPLPEQRQSQPQGR